VFPRLAGISSIVFLVLSFVPQVLAGPIDDGFEYVVLFALSFVTTFLSTSVSAARCHAADGAFHGREPGFHWSMRAVSASLGPIVIRSLSSATVSIIVRIFVYSDDRSPRSTSRLSPSGCVYDVLHRLRTGF